MAKEITATTTFCHFAVVGTRSNRKTATPVSEQSIQTMTPSGFSIRCNMSVDARKLKQIIEAIEVVERGDAYYVSLLKREFTSLWMRLI
jgi:hypothetical protein